MKIWFNVSGGKVRHRVADSPSSLSNRLPQLATKRMNLAAHDALVSDCVWIFENVARSIDVARDTTSAPNEIQNRKYGLNGSMRQSIVKSDTKSQNPMKRENRITLLLVALGFRVFRCIL